MSFNGGSYTGAILFTGFMYLGAAVLLWLVRAWKIGELEEKAAAEQADARRIDPVSEGIIGNQDDNAPTTGSSSKTSFAKRLVMWRRV